MKKISLILMIAAAAAVSCTREIMEPVGNELSVSLIAEGQDGLTKTYMEGYTPMWNAEDALGVFSQGGTTNSKFTNTTGQGATASFKGTVPAAGNYYAYYPFSSGGVNDKGALIVIPQDQKPGLQSFDGAADVLLSEVFNVKSTSTERQLKFRRIVGFIKVFFADGTSGSKLGSEYATAVSVQEDNGEERLVGTFRLGANGPEPISSGWRKVNATYDADTFQLINPEHAAYFGVLPQTFAAGSKLIITGETGNYTFSKTVTLPSDVKLGAGSLLPVRITLTDADVKYKSKPVKVEKLWERLSESAAWTTALSSGSTTGAAGSDLNIAVDDKYAYVCQFGGSKVIWAINVNDKNDVRLVNTSTVESTGFDGSIYLSCVRVVRKNDGTPVLIASNLFQDADNTNTTGRLYIWDNGIDEAPRVVNLQQWGAGRRLGDTFTTYGNFEDCWLIFGTQTGNGFVTFKLPATGNGCYLISRLAIDLTDFASYYPFPGELTRGMFSWRGGSHDDGSLYRNRLMTIDSTEEAIKTSGAHTATLSKLGTWMANSENNNGIGFNYIEFNGKRYVIWCMNSTSKKVFDLYVKEGESTTDWKTIIDTQGYVYHETFTGGVDTTWKNAADCQVWNTGSDLLIAINKINVGMAVLRLTTE